MVLGAGAGETGFTESRSGRIVSDGARLGPQEDYEDLISEKDNKYAMYWTRKWTEHLHDCEDLMSEEDH